MSKPKTSGRESQKREPHRQFHLSNPARRLPMAILLATAAALVCWQILIQPILGLANNGDFPRLIGRYALVPVDSETGSDFAYVVEHYKIDPMLYWHSGHFSSELLMIRPAVWLWRQFGGTVFDIRIIGAVHGACFMIAFALFFYRMRKLPPAAQWITGICAIWIFTDIAYVAYLNSFYMDAGSIILLLILAGLLVNVESAQGWIAATVVACLFLTTKSAHTPLALAFAPYWIFRLWKTNRGLAVVLPSLLLICAATFSSTVPISWRSLALFNVIYYQILPKAPDPVAALVELNLNASDARYARIVPYAPESPVNIPQWLENFYKRTNHGNLARYYLHHPQFTLTVLDEGLKQSAEIRPRNFANYTRSSNHPPVSNTTSFDSWSDFKTMLFQKWRYWVLAWFLIFVLLVRNAFAFLLVTIAAIEFGISTLLDSLETYRHLLIFHLATDLTILMGVVKLTQYVTERYKRHNIRYRNV